MCIRLTNLTCKLAFIEEEIGLMIAWNNQLDMKCGLERQVKITATVCILGGREYLLCSQICWHLAADLNLALLWINAPLWES